MNLTLVIIIAIALTGTIYFFYYKIYDFFSSVYWNRALDKARNDDYAMKLANSLNYCVERIDIGKDFSIENIKKATDDFAIENHTIRLIKKINQTSYLLLTKCHFKDFNITFGGMMGDVNRQYYFNYRLDLDSKAGVVRLYSDAFVKRDDKELRENFFQLLIKFLHNNSN